MSAELPTLVDLTPEWLTNLLVARGLNVKINSLTATPIGTGQVGATYRLVLDYAQRGDGAPDTLVAKLPSNDPVSRAAGTSHLTYIRESRFYQLFAGRKVLPVPQHLFIAFDDDTHNFALIMRDLPHHRAGNQLSTPTLDETNRAMDAAAAIHAAWWGDPALDTMDWLNGTKSVPPAIDMEALYTVLWPAFCDRYGARITRDIKRVGDAFIGRIGAWSGRVDGPRCLTHGDFRPDNMLFNLDDPAEPIVIVDWQTVGVGAGVSDIAYYAGTSFDAGVRRERELALFARYRDGLARHGVSADDLSGLWNDYRAASFSGFLMGATASMVVEQTARGDDMFLAMCGRSAAMVLDHSDAALPPA
jgi:Phosphotransferase enzyme family